MLTYAAAGAVGRDHPPRPDLGTAARRSLDNRGPHTVADGLERLQQDARAQLCVRVAAGQEAARTDPDIARDMQTIAANREGAFRRHIEAIAAHLAPGVSIDDGVAIYLTLVLPEVYRTLVIERGWTTDRYEDWLADALTTQLLP
ncbi:hypothetical protein ACIA5D_31515 [Actinoplanes sp. NPDC051513]|uniref:hypothetical protein n=1 Tax=Actinoplanes sp. NPDC051513 TaxID=3363908 RepID=UPI0037ABB8C7